MRSSLESPLDTMSLLTDRRRFLSVCSSLGLTSTLLPGVLWAMGQDKPSITPELLDSACKMAGLEVDEAQRKLMLAALTEQLVASKNLRALSLPNAVAPAFSFDPVLPGVTAWDTAKRPMKVSAAKPARGGQDLEALAFASVRELAELVRTRKVSSVALTELCLARLERLDAKLHCVITLTKERALAQAKEADREIAAGKYRGFLHGIPWGAKDLLSVKGYPTTWGAGGFEQQRFDEDATVVQRLDAAGAVLVAKLTLGALAMGDKWFGGMTRNPWKLEEGSSGSSAGSAAAVASGCLPFALGSETYGSIISPSTRCGTTGLRPTFGRVPRTGAMALSWTMDKLGPIARSVEDTALVLAAIQGPDGKDRTVRDVPFNWDASVPLASIRVGYLKADLEKERPEKAFDIASLEKLKALGVKLVPVALPDVNVNAMLPLLSAEAAAAFDSLTHSGRDKLLTEQTPDDWPNLFRVAQLLPAVDYINANRARVLAMEGLAKTFADVDVIVAPTEDPQVLLTNLTGHPTVVVPNGFRENGTPVSLSFLGRLFGEAKMLAVARAYQEATDFHLRQPKL
ncbi:MAG: amidase [Hyalangium sp.]|uniref:amidase n=1 Tax=Hyalangium sp. TaxID=2028555 RepID=UPI003899889F